MEAGRGPVPRVGRGHAVRVAVVGAGIVGSLIARELARYEADVLLVEREPDVGWGITKANSGIVHAGFHDPPGTALARFCALGNALFEQLALELDFAFHRCGAWVLAFTPDERRVLDGLLNQGMENGVPGLTICPPDDVLSEQPYVTPDVAAGLWAPTVGITEPWAVALAAAENARENGADWHVGEAVTGIAVRTGRVQAVVTDRGRYAADVVVNAAGLWADRIAAMAGLSEPRLAPRRGEYILLDASARAFVRSVLFPTPNPHSKGILVVPTVDGGVLLGPTAEDVSLDAKRATETTAHGMAVVRAGATRLVPALARMPAIHAFAGLRPESSGRDFVVGPTPVRGFYQAAAMRSPGITAAPALARWLAESISAEFSLQPKSRFISARKGIPRTADLSAHEWDALIERDPHYGQIACPCNGVTEGEIMEAIRRGATTVDGVKFRTRAGFGRCQGGSCADRVLAILTRELCVSPEEVTLRGPGSALVADRVRP